MSGPWQLVNFAQIASQDLVHNKHASNKTDSTAIDSGAEFSEPELAHLLGVAPMLTLGLGGLAYFLVR